MNSFDLIVGGRRVSSGVYDYQLDMERVIEDPGLMIAFALKRAGWLGKLPSFILKRVGKTPEQRFLTDYIRVHGKPKLDETKLDEIVFARYSVATNKEIEQAIDVAYRNRKKLYKSKIFGEPNGGLTTDERVDLLEKVGRLLIKEKETFKRLSFVEGKPLKIFEWEFHAVERMVKRNFLSFMASLIEERELESIYGRGRLYLIRQPVGLFVIYSPYNAALGLGLYAVLSSLISGNATIIKPPSKNPVSTIYMAYLFAEVFAQENVPEVFGCIVAQGEKLIGKLIKDPRVGGIMFYGQSEPGLRIWGDAARHAKVFVPELAGSDVCIVWRDADLEKAAKYVAKYRFLGSGQFCMSIKRLIVDRYIADDFIKLLVEEAQKHRPGLPSDPNTSLAIMPPNVLYRALFELNDAIAKGAKVECGGVRLNYMGEEDPAGLFLAPTVLTNVKPNMLICDPSREAFFPILPVQVADSIEEAIRLANRSNYGLRASLITENEELQRRFAVEVESGGVLINSEDHMHLDIQMPNLGGVKWTGVKGAKYFPLEMTIQKYVYIGKGYDGN